jgi:hypothetical protein
MKILILANPTSAATDYYRTIGPFGRLAELDKGISLEIQYPQNCKWHHMYTSDVMVVQRPNGDETLNFIAEAKRMGKKILLDIDDLLHGLTDANPASKHFNNPQVKQTMDAALSMGDALIVSTPFLAEFYAQYFDKPIYVVPNCPNMQSTPYGEILPQHSPLRMFWRGSTTHLADLWTIEKVWRLLGDDPATSLMFIGIEKFLLPWFKGKANFVPWQTMYQLFEGMRNSGIDWGLYPLTLDDFNAAKSNIFAMEVLTAGGAVLAPEGLAEWEHPGVVRYKNPMHLQVLLSEIRSGKIDKQETVKAGRAWMEEHRNLDAWNQLRKTILENL